MVPFARIVALPFRCLRVYGSNVVLVFLFLLSLFFDFICVFAICAPVMQKRPS